MRKLKLSLVITSAILILVFLGLFLFGYFKPKAAGLLVNSTPAALVFIDGAQMGQTPYKVSLPPKEITLRLVPQATGAPLAVFETSLNLAPGIETVVNRELGETEDASAGEIVSFEKVGKGETSLSIISVPDAAQVLVDGVAKGFAPVKPTILPGEHAVVLSAPGYNSRTLQVKTREGYKLIIIAKLAVNLEEKTLKPVQGLIEKKVVYVGILDTPTGFLRVRQEASTSTAEIGQVKPGAKYELVEEKEGWYRITFTTDKTGWISAKYAKKLPESTPSPSPISSPKPTSTPPATPRPTATP